MNRLPPIARTLLLPSLIALAAFGFQGGLGQRPAQGMQSRIGNGVGAELLKPAVGFVGGEAGRERDILGGSLRSQGVVHMMQ